MDKVSRQQRLTVIDLVAPKDNPAVVKSMFYIIACSQAMKDMEEAIEEAVEEGYFLDLPDSFDFDY